MVIHSGTSDRRVQYSRVGLEVKIYDTPAGGIRASQGTFSSSEINVHKRTLNFRCGASDPVKIKTYCYV